MKKIISALMVSRMRAEAKCDPEANRRPIRFVVASILGLFFVASNIVSDILTNESGRLVLDASMFGVAAALFLLYPVAARLKNPRK